MFKINYTGQFTNTQQPSLFFNEHEILQHYGKVTAEIAKSFAESEFEKYRIKQDRLFENDFDRFMNLKKEAEI